MPPCGETLEVMDWKAATPTKRKHLLYLLLFKLIHLGVVFKEYILFCFKSVEIRIILWLMLKVYNRKLVLMVKLEDRELIDYTEDPDNPPEDQQHKEVCVE